MSVQPIQPALIGQIMRDGRAYAHTSERERQEIALRLASPKRAEAGAEIVPQADAAHLPLFVQANEPKLI